MPLGIDVFPVYQEVQNIGYGPYFTAFHPIPFQQGKTHLPLNLLLFPEDQQQLVKLTLPYRVKHYTVIGTAGFVRGFIPPLIWLSPEALRELLPQRSWKITRFQRSFVQDAGVSFLNSRAPWRSE